MIVCFLKNQCETRDNLFFECSFSGGIWKRVVYMSVRIMWLNNEICHITIV